MPPEINVNLGVADAEVVRRLCLHLLDAFQAFMDAEGQAGRPLRYLDSLMGCHNFYKTIIVNLEELTGDDQGRWRQIAIDTLKMHLQVNPAAFSITPEQAQQVFDAQATGDQAAQFPPPGTPTTQRELTGYSRPECIFAYCPSQMACHQADRCHCPKPPLLSVPDE